MINKENTYSFTYTYKSVPVDYTDCHLLAVLSCA